MHDPPGGGEGAEGPDLYAPAMIVPHSFVAGAAGHRIPAPSSRWAMHPASNGERLGTLMQVPSRSFTEAWRSSLPFRLSREGHPFMFGFPILSGLTTGMHSPGP